jgi:hypothetical protein
MHLCYIDESGTADIPGNTSHFVLAGIAIPIGRWKDCDKAIWQIKNRYRLENAEIHTAWILRSYLEQSKIPHFTSLNYEQRRTAVERYRHTELLRLQRANNPKLYRQTQKNYRNTTAYLHLTQAQRQDFVREIASCVSGWGFARLFAECVDKIYFNPSRAANSVDEQCFEQVVSRFEQFLQITGAGLQKPNYGLLIHDNNETVAKRHTQMMKQFHRKGTLWTTLNNIIETPLFVDSSLTSMVQIADLCSYALRRYLENNDEDLFDLIFTRADRKDGVVVGVRHFTDPGCSCKICVARTSLP